MLYIICYIYITYIYVIYIYILQLKHMGEGKTKIFEQWNLLSNKS